MVNKLYVANLPYEMTELQIHDLFSQAGEINKIELIMDQAAQLSRGYGFIFMSTETGAAEAIRLFNGHPILNRPLFVNAALR